MIITRYSQWEWGRERESLLDDREIITAMRYNFDIKNSLFDYQNFSCTQNIYTYIPTVHYRRRHHHQFFKTTLHTPSDKENLIWNKSRNTFFIADNSNALSHSHSKVLDVFEITMKKEETTHIPWCYDKDISSIVTFPPLLSFSYFSPLNFLFFSVRFNLWTMLWILEYISVNARVVT